jgi:hypothetical protein
MCNFSFQGIATLCITVIPPFRHIVQAPSSGRIKQKEDIQTFTSHNGSKGGGIEFGAIKWEDDMA